MELTGNTSFQDGHLVNPKFLSKIKESCVTDTPLSPIYEDFDDIVGNDPMVLKNNNEGNKIIASNFKYNPNDD